MEYVNIDRIHNRYFYNVLGRKASGHVVTCSFVSDPLCKLETNLCVCVCVVESVNVGKSYVY